MTAPRTPTRTGSFAKVTLWDPVVRLTHWGVAIAVLSNALVTDGGSLTHVLLGWVVMALLLMRLVWGILGPAEARFSAFPPDPVAAVGHLRRLLAGRVDDHPSHNPAGALMIYAFWATLALMIGTGLYLTGGATPMQVAAEKAAVASGDWSALITDDKGDSADAGIKERRRLIQGVHKVAADLLLVLAAVHVAGIAVESRIGRRNLLRPMLTGKATRRR